MLVLLSMLGCSDDDDGGPGEGATEIDGATGGGDASPDDGDSDGSPLPVDSGTSAFARHLVVFDCAPADGPAFAILLGSENERDDCALHEVAPSLRIQVWVDPAQVDAPVTFSFAPGESLGAAQFCPGGRVACRSLESGTIHLETFRHEVGATGTYTLGSQEDGPIVGDFDATWCETDPPTTCG